MQVSEPFFSEEITDTITFATGELALNMVRLMLVLVSQHYQSDVFRAIQNSIYSTYLSINCWLWCSDEHLLGQGGGRGQADDLHGQHHQQGQHQHGITNTAISVDIRASNEGSRKFREYFTITGKAPTRPGKL